MSEASFGTIAFIGGIIIATFLGGDRDSLERPSQNKNVQMARCQLKAFSIMPIETEKSLLGTVLPRTTNHTVSLIVSYCMEANGFKEKIERWECEPQLYLDMQQNSECFEKRGWWVERVDDIHEFLTKPSKSQKSQ